MVFPIVTGDIVVGLIVVVKVVFKVVKGTDLVGTTCSSFSVIGVLRVVGGLVVFGGSGWSVVVSGLPVTGLAASVGLDVCGSFGEVPGGGVAGFVTFVGGCVTSIVVGFVSVIGCTGFVAGKTVVVCDLSPFPCRPIIESKK